MEHVVSVFAEKADSTNAKAAAMKKDLRLSVGKLRMLRRLLGVRLGR